MLGCSRFAILWQLCTATTIGVISLMTRTSILSDKADVKRSVTIYGFGSAFNGADRASDVDLLIIHDGNDAGSCQLAIQCLRILTSRISNAHVTKLSSKEEAEFGFRETSSAIRLGIVRRDSLAVDSAD